MSEIETVKIRNGTPVNKLSINFHQKMGFEIEPGDGIIDDVPITLNYLGKDNPKVLFKKIMT